MINNSNEVNIFIEDRPTIWDSPGSWVVTLTFVGLFTFLAFTLF